MKFKLVLITLLMIFTIYISGIEAQNLQEVLDVEINIAPHVILETFEDVNINIDQPRSNGEIMELNSLLRLKTNTDIYLSWESTELRHIENGRILSAGIPEKQLKKLASGQRVEAFIDHPFGYNVALIEREYRDGEQIKSEETVLSSSAENGKILRSQNKYEFKPGNYDFAINIRYFWSRDANWSEVVAGKYRGKIIYTVSAVED